MAMPRVQLEPVEAGTPDSKCCNRCGNRYRISEGFHPVHGPGSRTRAECKDCTRELAAVRKPGLAVHGSPWEVWTTEDRRPPKCFRRCKTFKAALRGGFEEFMRSFEMTGEGKRVLIVHEGKKRYEFPELLLSKAGA